MASRSEFSIFGMGPQAPDEAVVVLPSYFSELYAPHVYMLILSNIIFPCESYLGHERIRDKRRQEKKEVNIQLHSFSDRRLAHVQMFRTNPIN